MLKKNQLLIKDAVKYLEEICRKAGGKAQKAYEKVHGISPAMAIVYVITKVPQITEKGQKTARRAIYAGIKL